VVDQLVMASMEATSTHGLNLTMKANLVIPEIAKLPLTTLGI
jgi:hypothetical protein